MAEQDFSPDENKFWMDFHKCSTESSRMTFECRIEECYRYGIHHLEIVYGTPDSYEGSIEAAVDEIAKSSEFVEEFEKGHANAIFRIRENSCPQPQDHDMRFTGFIAEFENRDKQDELTRDYRPCRPIFSAFDVSSECGCSAQYVRNVAKELDIERAEYVRKKNEHSQYAVYQWEISSSGLAEIRRRWLQDREAISNELKLQGASDDEVSEVVRTFHTPLKREKVVRRAHAALSRFRKRQAVENA